MNELIKIKMSDRDNESWPLFLQDALENKNQFCLEIESEQKLCDKCDYLFFSEGKLQFHSVDLGLMCFDFKETWALTTKGSIMPYLRNHWRARWELEGKLNQYMGYNLWNWKRFVCL